MRLYNTTNFYPTYNFMFVQRKTTELYQNLHNSLVQWQEFSPNGNDTQKPFFILLTHPHCMWTEKLCAEAFTNPTIVNVLQEHFTPCLVDEHTDPELYILMNQSLRIFLKEQNIRPGCIFTHQTGEPFFGGGYHPPAPRYGMPSFIQFLHQAIRLLEKNSSIVPLLLRHNNPPKTQYSWCYSWDTQIDKGYEDAFDFMNHGFGIAPKYVHVARLKTWFSFPKRQNTVTKTVEQMSTSPVLDPINGCIYRKCEDALWELPVREACLEDQTEFVSLLMKTHPNTPCVSFLLSHISQQYTLENGLSLNSISYHPPDLTSSKWPEEYTHFPVLPSVETCSKLIKHTAPNIKQKDYRAICASNARLLHVLVQHQEQNPTEEGKQRINHLETSIWTHFGWKEKREWYHTQHQQMLATGLDIALVIQAMLAVQKWSPQPERHQEILALVDYWEEKYLDKNICHTHPQKRFFVRGIDLIANTCASTQEEAAYTLSLLQNAGIKTSNKTRSFVELQQWLVYKNPKLLSTALFAWQEVPLPILQESTNDKIILAFGLHKPISHLFLRYAHHKNSLLWAQCETSLQYLFQKGYTDCIIKAVPWDVCNRQGQLHTGALHSEDIERFLDCSRTLENEVPLRGFSDGKRTYIHRTYTVKIIDGATLLTSPNPILCFCMDKGVYWWITDNKLHSSTSDTPHTLPSPIVDPISMHMHHGALLIAQREDLWLFHISQEQFGRYAGKKGSEPKDGLVHTAVFQNITALCTYENYILLSDAYQLRIIDTQVHTVHTLGDHPPFSYSKSIIMFDKHIYIADEVQQCIWKYSLEEERTQKWSCDTPVSIFAHNEVLWALCRNDLIELRTDLFF